MNSRANQLKAGGMAISVTINIPSEIAQIVGAASCSET